MDSETYWQKRAEEREKYWHKKCQDTIEKELASYYRKALESIQKDIAALYGRFASDNKLSLQEATALLQGQEYRSWRKSIEEYVAEIQATGDKGLERELNTLAMRSRITRLDKLYSETLMELDNMGRKVSGSMRSFLSDAYKDGYYHDLFEIGQTEGLRSAVTAVDNKQVENVLRTRWSGKNYSQRIWQNTRKLGTTIRDFASAGVHRGLSVDKMSKMVEERMGVGHSQAVRLVRTEMNFVQNQAAHDSIKESGMKYYRFVATLDRRTSTQCREHDGKVYPIDDFSPGTTAPPLHPHCRSTIVGSLKGYSKYDESKRAARNEKGQYVRVPASMTYEEWKQAYVDKTVKLEDWKKQKLFDYKTNTLTDKVNTLKATASSAEKTLQGMPNKVYSGIWKNDVSLSDWESKQASIPAKLQYFDAQIAQGNSVTKFEAYKNDLAEFDAKGRAYSEAKKALSDARAALDDAEDKLYRHLHNGQPDPVKDAYSDKRKNAAYWFKDKKAADAVLRGPTGKTWQGLSADEKEALHDYTRKSGAFNRPLAGYEKPWSQSGSGWEDKFKKGVGNVWIDYEGKGKKIRHITDAISRSSYNFDIWLQRGCTDAAMDSFFKLAPGEFAKLSDTDLQTLVAKRYNGTMDNFISTTACKGGGFGGNVILNIYAPKGTNMIYAEPFSAFGIGDGLKWDGVKKQVSFGSEFEVIVQRGARYRVTKIEHKGGKYYIDLEIHPEMSYNLYQQDINEWQGSRVNYKGQTISVADEKKGL